MIKNFAVLCFTSRQRTTAHHFTGAVADRDVYPITEGYYLCRTEHMLTAASECMFSAVCRIVEVQRMTSILNNNSVATEYCNKIVF